MLQPIFHFNRSLIDIIFWKEHQLHRTELVNSELIFFFYLVHSQSRKRAD